MVPRFNHVIEGALSFAGICMLLAPKFNIITLDGQTAGIRADDVVLCFIGCLMALAFVWTGRLTFSKLEVSVILFALTGLLSNAVNMYLFGRSNILYSVRIIEYFVFFYLGCIYARRNRLSRVVKIVMACNGTAMVLQKAGLVGAFTSSGMVAVNNVRPTGLTGGPWEVGALFNIGFSILIFDPEHRRSTRLVLMLFIPTFVLVLITGARMPTIAHVLVLLMFLYSRSHSRLRFTVGAAAALAGVWICLMLVPNEVSERSANLSSSENLDIATHVYRAAEPFNNLNVGDSVPNVEGIDMSAIMRAAEWSVAIKTWLVSKPSWVLGVGPGTFGIALDGGWLRLLTETGVLGLVLFISILAKISGINEAMGGVVTSVCISMAMIDIQLAYKVMSLLFFCAGYFTLNPLDPRHFPCLRSCGDQGLRTVKTA